MSSWESLIFCVFSELWESTLLTLKAHVLLSWCYSFLFAESLSYYFLPSCCFLLNYFVPTVQKSGHNNGFPYHFLKLLGDVVVVSHVKNLLCMLFLVKLIPVLPHNKMLWVLHSAGYFGFCLFIVNHNWTLSLGIVSKFLELVSGSPSFRCCYRSILRRNSTLKPFWFIPLTAPRPHI